MASLGGEQQILTNSHPDEPVPRTESREGSMERRVSKDRDDKLKIARDRQNEERHRKIEELKAQAEAAQRYREQKEEERRRRIDEIRHRDSEKRQQVEERKKAIMEAEKERREYILRKNQERESRLETKKRDKNSIAFAFGSSTPRLLEPAEFGMVSTSTFWGQRRSTSISNVAGASLSRRSSERELADGGFKKRATSASATERHDDGTIDTSHIIFRSVARRKTDLMPTITSPRDGHYGSRSSLSQTPRTPGRAYSMNRLDQLAQPIRRNGEHIRAILERERREQMDMLDETESLGGGRRVARKSNTGAGGTSNTATMSRSMSHLAGSSGGRKYNLGGGSRSGNVTPGGSISTSRPGSAMSTSTNFSTSGYVNRRAAPVRKPRPASIAGTGVSLEEIAKLKKENKPPVKSSSPLSAQTTPKRTSNMMSTSLIVTSSSSRLSSAEKKTPSKKDPNVPKPMTSRPLSKTASTDRLNKVNNKEQKPKDLPISMTKSSIIIPSVVTVDKTNTASSDQAIVETDKKDSEANNPATPAKTKDEKNALNTVKTEDMVEAVVNEKPLVDDVVNVKEVVIVTVAVADEKIDQGNEKDSNAVTTVSKTENNSVIIKESSEVRELTPPSLAVEVGDMTASMIAKSKITTEEEAKAALAERRRLARVEAERQAELERQRVETERVAELKRQEEEAERQRQFEEEATRLAAEQRKSEEERLRQAIEVCAQEAKQREEEERLKREDEEKQRIEREEAEKKAKEEAEKQRLEVAERLKREEKEREERRKRVEAIMSRTRKGGTPGTPNSTPVKENNENKVVLNEQNQQNAQSTPTTITENNSSSNDESNSTSGSTTSATTPIIPPNTVAEPQNSQAMYEQSVIEKEALLMKGLSSTVIDENTKNLQQQQQASQQPSQTVEITNGKLHTDFPNNDVLLQNTTISSVANGNGHIENFNNKNELNILQDVVAPATNQLIDFSIESQGDINNSVNYNNNNSLLATTNSLVTADSHENTDISLL